jgi:hypothetical protein
VFSDYPRQSSPVRIGKPADAKDRLNAADIRPHAIKNVLLEPLPAQLFAD